MIAGALAAAGEVATTPGRWSLQPSLVIFGAVVVLLAGFYLGRASDGIHAAWLRGWETLGYWLTRVVFGVGVIAVVWFVGRWWLHRRGGG